MMFRARLMLPCVVASWLVLSCQQPSSSAWLRTDPPDTVKTASESSDPFEMTEELEDVTRRLTNRLSTCWLEAGVKELEYYHYWKTGERLALSVNYVMLSAIRDRYERLVHGAKFNEADLQAGGEINEVRRLANRFGLIPETSWNGPSPHWEAIAAKTVKAARKYARKMRNAMSDDDRERLMNRGRKELENLIANASIDPPAFLVVDGQRISPVDFADSFIDEDYNDFILYVARIPNTLPRNKISAGTTQNLYETRNILGIQKAIRANIDMGRSVGTSVFWATPYISDDQGVIKFEDGPFPEEFEGHVINLVGYKINDQDQITALKFENTWGRSNGYKGMYYLTWIQFEEMFEAMSIQDGYAFARDHQISGRRITE